MVITTMDLMATHPFLENMPHPWLERLSYQAKRAVHHIGSRLFREGKRADRFWLIRDGRVYLEFNVPVRVIAELDARCDRYGCVASGISR
jgi:CRP/FNR family cyclic AMP-dependent transcriptional regulator